MTRETLETVYTANPKPFIRGTQQVEGRLARLDRVTSDRFDRIDRRWARSQRAIDGVRSSIAGLVAAAGLAAFGRLAVTVSRDFEAALNRVRAASGASAAEIEALADAARRLGRETSFSASDAAAGIETLVRNGLNVSQILGGALDASLRLAEATGGDLASAADLATDVMGQFGIEAAQLSRVVDLVSGGVVNSKFGFDDFTGAVAQAGGVAATAGVEFNDFVTAVAGTAQAFASGSDAGTSFKTFVTSLSGNSAQAEGRIKALGLEFFDAAGNLRPMREIAAELQDSLGGLSEQARTTELRTIFGTDALRTAAALTQQGAEGFDRLAAAIGGISAADQAAARMTGLEGATKRATAAFEGLLLEIGSRGGLSAATEATELFADAMVALTENLGLAVGAAGTLAGARGIGALVQALQAERVARAGVVAQRQAELASAGEARRVAQVELASRQLNLRTLQAQGATQARIAAAQRALETATLRSSAATQAYANAVGALSVATGRLTVAATIATRVMTGLRGVMSFFGGPVGLAITAVTLGIGVLATRSAEATTSVDGLRASYGELTSQLQRVQDLDRQLANDQDLLRRKTEALSGAIAAQGPAAGDAARLEIDAINTRIRANEKLREEYARVLRAQLAVFQRDLATGQAQFRSDFGGSGVTRSEGRRAARTGRARPPADFIRERQDAALAEREAAIVAAQQAGNTLSDADVAFLKTRAGLAELELQAQQTRDALDKLAEPAEAAPGVATVPPPGSSGGGGGGGGARSRGQDPRSLSDDRISALEAERAAIGKVGLELAFLEERERALGDLRRGDQPLTARQVQQATSRAVTAATLRLEIDRMREAEQLLALAKEDGLSADERQVALMERLEQLRPALIQLAGSEEAAQNAITAAIRRTNDELERQGDIGTRVADTLVDGLENIATNFDDAGQAARRLGLELASLALRNVAQPLLQTAFTAIGSAFGFNTGGYTGDGPVDQIAGAVHGQEFVVRAPYATRYRAQLEALNRGDGAGFLGGGSGRPAPVVAPSAPRVAPMVAGGMTLISNTSISIEGEAAQDRDAVLDALRPELDRRDRQVLRSAVDQVQRNHRNNPKYLGT